MELYPETDFYSLSGDNEEHIIAAVRLSNGVLLLVRENGTGMGTDGHVWAHVSRRIGADDYEELGWTPDRTEPVTLHA